MERCSATVYQPKLSAICQGWENWLMSLGQSSKRKSLMEERKLIQLYSMQKRQGVFAIFICQFSSYQSQTSYCLSLQQKAHSDSVHLRVLPPSTLSPPKKVFKGLVKVSDALYWLREVLHVRFFFLHLEKSESVPTQSCF